MTEGPTAAGPIWEVSARRSRQGGRARRGCATLVAVRPRFGRSERPRAANATAEKAVVSESAGLQAPNLRGIADNVSVEGTRASVLFRTPNGRRTKERRMWPKPLTIRAQSYLCPKCGSPDLVRTLKAGEASVLLACRHCLQISCVAQHTP